MLQKRSLLALSSRLLTSRILVAKPYRNARFKKALILPVSYLLRKGPHPERAYYWCVCLQCPVYDMVDNVEFVGFHQTVTRSGAITVKVIFIYKTASVNHPVCLCTHKHYVPSCALHSSDSNSLFAHRCFSSCGFLLAVPNLTICNTVHMYASACRFCHQLKTW